MNKINVGGGGLLLCWIFVFAINSLIGGKENYKGNKSKCVNLAAIE